MPPIPPPQPSWMRARELVVALEVGLADATAKGRPFA